MTTPKRDSKEKIVRDLAKEGIPWWSAFFGGLPIFSWIFWGVLKGYTDRAEFLVNAERYLASQRAKRGKRK